MSTQEQVQGNSLIGMAMEYAWVEERALSLADLADGELDTELDAYLDSIKHNLGMKVDGYKVILNRLALESERLKANAEEFAAAARSLARVHLAIRERVKEAMKILNKEEIAGDKWTFKLCQAKPKLIVPDDVKTLPKEYVLVRNLIEPNKDYIREALDKGVEIQGCKLEPVTSLRISVSKKT